MIKRLKVVRGDSTDPFRNLALERYLLETVDPGTCILYLWQNANTVVIGRNQNPWKECRMALLREDGVRLARRLSGGGAVFHDLGNLNFTFLMAEEDYDLDRQFRVIEQACAVLGIRAVRSGRNDLTSRDGRKFSGNAFYKRGGRAYHHGTLMVDVDREKMSAYLTPSEAKLRSKGVDSVRSRVVSLNELAEAGTSGEKISTAALADALEKAFGEVYGISPEMADAGGFDGPRLRELTEIQSSDDWNLGTRIPFDVTFADRFGWGEVEICIGAKGSNITDVRVYSDAMDEGYITELEDALRSCSFSKADLTRAVPPSEDGKQADIRGLIERQDI